MLAGHGCTVDALRPSCPRKWTSPAMTLPTSSKTALLLQCGWGFGPETAPTEARNSGEAALYGTAYHEGAAVELGGREPADFGAFEVEAKRHLAETMPPLNEWLTAHAYRTDHEIVEVPWLYNVRSGWTRRTELDKATHRYRGHGAHDLGGTVDFASWRSADRRLLVLDHKTGERDPGDPGEHAQLLSLAVMAAAHFKKPQSVTLVLHWARRGGPAEIRARAVSLGRVERHAHDLEQAFKEIGSGRLRVGPECDFCHARFGCPTRTNALALFKPEATALSREWTADEAAFVHEKLAFYRDMASMLNAKAHETIAKHGPGLRPDGKIVDLVTRPYSNLSLASIRRALPKEEAAALIDELGAKGCIETHDRVELRARKPPPPPKDGAV